jgi:hypothetical protein
MAADLLAASEAAGSGIPTREWLRLVHKRKIRFMMVKGIAHVPDDAVEEFRSPAARPQRPRRQVRRPGV